MLDAAVLAMGPALARRAAFDTSAIPQLLADAGEGRIVAVNRAFCVLSGRGEAETVGRTDVELGFWSDEGARNSFLSCLAVEGRLAAYPIRLGPLWRGAEFRIDVDPADGPEGRFLLILVRGRRSQDTPEADESQRRGLAFLARAANRFLVEEGGDLYASIADELRALAPNSLAAVCADPEGDRRLLLKVVAAPERLRAVAAETLARFRGTPLYRPDDAAFARLLGGVAYAEDPAELRLDPAVDSEGFAELLSGLAVRAAWSIGLAWDGQVYGMATILLRDPDPAPDREVLETFVRQAAVALQRNQRARALAASLKEKETLLREIHHRVKNNLQIVASLIKLQTDRSSERAAASVLGEAADRVQSIALVHNMLYGSTDLSAIDASQYLRKLVDQIVGSARIDLYGVELVFDLEPVRLAADQAVPVGLIVNELVTNALKYGVGRAGPGTLKVSLIRSGRRAVVAVADSGGRLSPGFDLKALKTLGMQLVAGLAEQLGGALSCSVGNMTEFRVDFGLKETSDAENLD
jgi:two-component sensor histidine kinase